MAIPVREQRILLQKSGNRCAFPTCRRLLTAASSPAERAVVLGEIAHIVAESPDGPRGDSPMTLKERNQYDNLILLCNIHHQLVDDRPQTYTAERLLQMKLDHEAWVAKALGRGYDDRGAVEAPSQVSEIVYSSLLPVKHMPRFVYGAPCSLADERVAATRVARLRSREMAPFIIRNGMLFAFQDLNDPANPFRELVVAGTGKQHLAREWWEEPDRLRWFVELLNRALNKLTGRRGLHLDKEHQRYYFQPDEVGRELMVEYRPLNQNRASRKVVWQPRDKRTGAGRGYWYHRAVALRFFRIASEAWALSIRPELRVTKDGVHSLRSDRIGSRVTRKKSRMFNYDLLGEVQFWRDYLSESRPRMILHFGPGQNLVISTRLLEGAVTWPGIPEEHSKPFKNIAYVDDLFSWAEMADLGDTDDGFTDWDEDEVFEEDDGFES